MNVGCPNRLVPAGTMLRESDMPIVAKIPGKVKAGVAKGVHYCKSNFSITNNSQN